MASFATSLINPVTGVADISIASGIITIIDHSNYDDSSPEAGHARANFSSYYKMKITLPDLTEYLYSTLSDGDAVIAAPSAGSAGDPHVHYTYLTGDGQYWVTIYTVPTYSAIAAYLIATTPYVYYGTTIWRALQNSTGQTPAENAYWTAVTDIDLLPAKYRLAQRIVVYAEAKKCYARRIYNANAVNNLIGSNWEKLLRDPEFIDAIKLFVSINSIPVLMAADRWTEVDTNINLCKQIASKY